MFHDDRDAALINQLKNSELNVDGIVKNWEKLFKVPTTKRRLIYEYFSSLFTLVTHGKFPGMRTVDCSKLRYIVVRVCKVGSGGYFFISHLNCINRLKVFDIVIMFPGQCGGFCRAEGHIG